MLATAHEMLAKQQQWDPARTSNAPLCLKVITGDYLLDHVIKPALPELIQRFPRVSLEFQVANERHHIFEKIRARQVDLAIYTGGSPSPDMADSKILSSIPCSLYASPAIARHIGDDIAIIAETPFILPTASRMRSWVLGALERAGINPKIIAARTQFGDVLAEMVREGLGIGLLFDDHAEARFGNQIQKLPVEIEPAYRVVIFGERAKLDQAQPCLDFLQELCSASRDRGA
jgi:DNA-binding transcriptional LysR family regulator